MNSPQLTNIRLRGLVAEGRLRWVAANSFAVPSKFFPLSQNLPYLLDDLGTVNGTMRDIVRDRSQLDFNLLERRLRDALDEAGENN